MGPLYSDDDVNASGHRPFGYLNHFRPRLIGRVGVEGARIKYAVRVGRHHARHARISHADQIAAFGQTVDAINATVINDVHFVIDAVVRTLPGTVLVDQCDLHTLIGQRTPLDVGDASGDHAATFEFDLNVLDVLPLRDADPFVPLPETVIARRGEARRERRDEITPRRDAREAESPVFIGLRVLNYGRRRRVKLSLWLDYDGYAPRRLAIQRDASRNRGGARFRRSGLAEDRVAEMK